MSWQYSWIVFQYHSVENAHEIRPICCILVLYSLYLHYPWGGEEGGGSASLCSQTFVKSNKEESLGHTFYHVCDVKQGRYNLIMCGPSLLCAHVVQLGRASVSGHNLYYCAVPTYYWDGWFTCQKRSRSSDQTNHKFIQLCDVSP